MDLLFSLANAVALLSWIALVAFPRFNRFIAYVPLLFAAMYLLLIVMSAEAFGSGGGFGSLAQVEKLFSFRPALLAGWLHYLAFDLFVGVYITKDSLERGIRPWKVAPAKLLTFMFGPVGFLVYSLQRRW